MIGSCSLTSLSARAKRSRATWLSSKPPRRGFKAASSFRACGSVRKRSRASLEAKENQNERSLGLFPSESQHLATFSGSVAPHECIKETNCSGSKSLRLPANMF